MKGSPRAYPRSMTVLRRHGVQWPEALPPDAWAEYMATRAAEESNYDALDRARREKLLDAAARGHVARTARRAARRAKVAAAMAADPTQSLAALARTLGVSLSSLYHDRRALAAMNMACCPACGRPLHEGAQQ